MDRIAAAAFALCSKVQFGVFLNPTPPPKDEPAFSAQTALAVAAAFAFARRYERAYDSARCV
jgi:hypothetical protein